MAIETMSTAEVVAYALDVPRGRRAARVHHRALGEHASRCLRFAVLLSFTVPSEISESYTGLIMSKPAVLAGEAVES